jgi:HNH endonuclease
MLSNKVPVGFSEETVWKTWIKGIIAGGNDPILWRKDECGAWIFRGHYGRKDSEYGWVIDHIKPLVEGGTDDISNLRPMHWDNTGRKADGDIECHATSTGVYNEKPIENKIIEHTN